MLYAARVYPSARPAPNGPPAATTNVHTPLHQPIHHRGVGALGGLRHPTPPPQCVGSGPQCCLSRHLPFLFLPLSLLLHPKNDAASHGARPSPLANMAASLASPSSSEVPIAAAPRGYTVNCSSSRSLRPVTVGSVSSLSSDRSLYPGDEPLRVARPDGMSGSRTPRSGDRSCGKHATVLPPMHRTGEAGPTSSSREPIAMEPTKRRSCRVVELAFAFRADLLCRLQTRFAGLFVGAARKLSILYECTCTCGIKYGNTNNLDDVSLINMSNGVGFGAAGNVTKVLNVDDKHVAPRK